MAAGKNGGKVYSSGISIDYPGDLVHALLFSGGDDAYRFTDDLTKIFGVRIEPVQGKGEKKDLHSRKNISHYHLFGKEEVLEHAGKFVNEIIDLAAKDIRANNIHGVKPAKQRTLFFYENHVISVAARYEREFQNRLMQEKQVEAAAALGVVKQFQSTLNALKPVNLKDNFGDMGRALRDNKAFQEALGNPENIRNQNDMNNLLAVSLNGKGGLTVGVALVQLGLMSGASVPQVSRNFSQASGSNNDNDQRGVKLLLPDAKPSEGKSGRKKGKSGGSAKNRSSLAVPEPSPRSQAQALFSMAIDDHVITCGIGTSGGGKSYEAIRKGLEMVASGDTSHITIIRPQTTTSGKDPGAVPGDATDKYRPYTEALDTTIKKITGGTGLQALEKMGVMQIQNINFLRGATLEGYVIIDEGQNLANDVFEDLLFRPDEGQKIVVTGNIRNQIDIDLRRGHPGILYALDIYGHLKVNGVTSEGIGTDDPEKIKIVEQVLDKMAFIPFPSETGSARNELAAGLSILARSPLSLKWQAEVAREFYSKEQAELFEKLQPRIERAEKTLQKMNDLLLSRYLQKGLKNYPGFFTQQKAAPYLVKASAGVRSFDPVS
jgi:hypothetical protein